MILADLQRALYEAHRDLKRPTRWSISHPAYIEICREAKAYTAPFNVSGDATLLGRPFVTSFDQKEPFILETER